MAGWLAFLYSRPNPPTGAVERLEIAGLDPSVTGVGALSPDGTRLVLQSPNRLWLRRMDSLEVHPIEGTEGTNGLPFWSPDSRLIAFGSAGKLKKIAAEGGPPEVLCDAGYIAGGFWTAEGKIVFADVGRPQSLWEVPVAGGVSSPLPGVEHGNPLLLLPVLLPDGKHFLYTSGNTQRGDVHLGSLDSKPGQQSSKRLLTALGALYAPSTDDPYRGYVVFVRPASGAGTNTLMAQPFDPRKLELLGEPVTIAQQVSPPVSVSIAGTLVYGSGGVAPGTGQLTLFDRTGKILGTVGEPGDYSNVAFSPDGKRVVATRNGAPAGSQNLWMMDLARDTSTRFTFDSGSDIYPVWSPDGNRVAFASSRSGVFQMFQKLSNGGDGDESLFKSDSLLFPLSWSDDGRFLLFGGGPTASEAVTSVLQVDGNGHAVGKPFPFVEKGFGVEGRFSPGSQGHPLWVAYSSNESGRYEVYVRPFDPNSPNGTPPGGGKWQVSAGGGLTPRWNSNGKELFYVAPDGTVMSVEVSGGAVFQAGIPKPLFKVKGFTPQTINNVTFALWDAGPGGKKFIFPLAPTVGAPPRFIVVLNWPSLLKK